jgi:hypothetical protein
MAEQGGPNETGKAGHNETNKVAGEGAVNASGAETTSGGGEGRTPRDPDAAPEQDLSGGTDPSMRGALAQPGQGKPSTSSVAPGGDKISNPDVNGQDMARETLGEDKRGPALPGR